MPKPTAPKPPTSRRPAPNEKRVAKRLTSGSTHSCRCCCFTRRFVDCARRVAHVSCRGTLEYKGVEAFPRHETCAFRGMHNPRSDSISQHALEVVELCRPLVEVIQRRDRDLASQLRWAVSSIALNLAEGFGVAGGRARVRFETAHGSLHEARAGIRLAVAWRYVTGAACTEALTSLDALGARVFGLVRR